MSNKIFVAQAPHMQGHLSSNRLMRDVIVALMPALVVSVVCFGFNALTITAVSVASCVFFEWVIRRFLLAEKSMGGDLSSVVTGVLLAFNVPASLPLWIVVIGAAVAIIVAKMTFGGLGRNPFNPALVARVFLLIAYPVQMTYFPAVQGGIDAFSGATPLAAVKAGFDFSAVNYQDMLLGFVPGSLGEVASLLLIMGGLYLLVRRVITIHIPFAVLMSMAVFAAIYALCGGYGVNESLQFALFHILGGGALLGAFFMATDYATSPMTQRGMVIYGVGIGVLTMVIRLWGSYPEGMSFAILLLNAATPLINKYVKQRRFGIK